MVSSETSTAIRSHSAAFFRHISVRSPITLQMDELRPLFPPQLDALHAAASLRRRKGALGQISAEHPLYRHAECPPSVGARA